MKLINKGRCRKKFNKLKAKMPRYLDSNTDTDRHRLAVRAVALECWRAIWLGTGPPTLLATLIGVPAAGTHPPEATHPGCLPPTSASKDTFVWSAYRVWNFSEELQRADSLAAAKRAAASLASIVPV